MMKENSSSEELPVTVVVCTLTEMEQIFGSQNSKNLQLEDTCCGCHEFYHANFVRAFHVPILTSCFLSRYELDMLAFSGCYYGGGEKEVIELGRIRKRWKTLHVRSFKIVVSLWLWV
jgi:hypothetical protein